MLLSGLWVDKTWLFIHSFHSSIDWPRYQGPPSHPPPPQTLFVEKSYKFRKIHYQNLTVLSRDNSGRLKLADGISHGISHELNWVRYVLTILRVSPLSSVEAAGAVPANCSAGPVYALKWRTHMFSFLFSDSSFHYSSFVDPFFLCGFLCVQT